MTDEQECVIDPIPPNTSVRGGFGRGKCLKPSGVNIEVVGDDGEPLDLENLVRAGVAILHDENDVVCKILFTIVNLSQSPSPKMRVRVVWVEGAS